MIAIVNHLIKVPQNEQELFMPKGPVKFEVDVAQNQIFKDVFDSRMLDLLSIWIFILVVNQFRIQVNEVDIGY